VNNLVVVAIPNEDDYVWKISSEKVPHMTLLFLGDVGQVKNLPSIAQFVQHTSERSLNRFGLGVDRRGVLGEDEADVIFFDDSYGGLDQVKDFRNYLLKDDNIRSAYDSVEQFPEFNAHLTLGYPDTPAKEDDREYPGIQWVNFDRIGLWFGDYEGFEFPLPRDNWGVEVAMADSKLGSDTVQEILHYGTKGMRWGHRKDRPSEVTVTTSRSGKKIKTTGGHNQDSHPDAIKARTSGQKGKASGLHSLSNKELQDYAARLSLEQNVKRLEVNEKPAVKKFIAGLLMSTAKQQATTVVNQKASAQVASMLKK
jgi:2'-5' RNA ligase